MTAEFDLLVTTGALAFIAVLLAKDRMKQEPFWGTPGMTYKRDIQAKMQPGMPLFSVPPTYQSALSPRFSNVNYGAFIKYNIPTPEHLGVPNAPLGGSYPQTFGGPVEEGFNAVSLETEGESGLAPDMSAHQSAELNAMNAGSFGAEQPIVYDRLIFANKKSRLNGLGDPIRGDLPVVPIAGDWFRPSVQPNIDLREGALNVIAGADNSTANELRALRANWSGKTNLAMAQKDIRLGGGQSDIIVTAFP
jgi:hypothetical protein